MQLCLAANMRRRRAPLLVLLLASIAAVQRASAAGAGLSAEDATAHVHSSCSNSCCTHCIPDPTDPSLPNLTTPACLPRILPPAVGTLRVDRVIFSGKLASGMGDSSYKGGRLADLTGPAAGGGVAATFNPKPGAGLQFYFGAGAIDASKYAGLAFKIAADTRFAVNGGVTVGVQVAPGTPKVGWGWPCNALLPRSTVAVDRCAACCACMHKSMTWAVHGRASVVSQGAPYCYR